MSTASEVSDTADLTLRIAGMSCAACQAHVQRALASVPGVLDAHVDLLAHTAHLTADPAVDTQTLTTAVRNAGYDVLTSSSAQQPPSLTSPATADESSDPHLRTLGLRGLLSLIAGALAMLLSMPLMRSGPNTGVDPVSAGVMRLVSPLLPGWLLTTAPQLLRWTLFALALLTMLFAAPEIYRAAWRAARHRATNMNTLVALGTLAAFLTSACTTVSLSIGRQSAIFNDVYYEAVILILAFLLAGRWLEARARLRATASLRTSAHTDVGQARWITDGSPTSPEELLHAPETLLPLDAVVVGDILRVAPGDRVPLDAIILAGRSSVDESMLTGEPLPATRSVGDKVFSGTLNVDGSLLVRATALGVDSMHAQIARLLERARATRAPLQRLADRVSGVFVPTVLGLATLTFIVWAVADNTGMRHLGYGRALSLAIAVLVVACPCAMGLAVPAAVAVSLGAASRAGMLIKGGEALERLASLDTVAFDKTGTLTEGKPRIVAFEVVATSPQHTPDPRALLSYAVAVEFASTHPLAEAIRSFAAEEKAPPTTAIGDAQILPGTGARATLDGRHVALGNASLLPAGTPRPAPPEGLQHATPMYLLVDGQHQATFYAVDIPRPSAKPALEALAGLHLQPVLLTGDTPEAAHAIAAEVGIQDTRARLLPTDKVAAVVSLQRQGRRVGMVGDGMNDAAALAQADAGIAMASGADLAREAGHVLLLHHDLALVPLAIRLARRTRRLMRQNLAWAMLYNVLGIPIAAGVLLPRFGIALSPALASAAMALSSVSVLLNSLRLANPPRR